MEADKELMHIIEKYQINDKSRVENITHCKHYFRWFCHVRLNLTQDKIAEMTGCNRSTIVNSVRKCEDWKTDKVFIQNTAEISKDLSLVKLYDPFKERMAKAYNLIKDNPGISFNEWFDKI